MAKAEDATRAVEEYVQEHAGEEGLLAGAMEDDKISKALASSRLKEAKREGADPDEIKALQNVIDLYNEEGAAKRAAKDAQAALDLATLKKYGDLSERDVKVLVLDDKWHASVAARVSSEVDSLTLALVGRIEELGDRYAETVGALDAELSALEAKVAGHLREMGVGQ